jgi:hypothetical protein
VEHLWFEIHRGKFDSRFHCDGAKVAKTRYKTKQEIDLNVDGTLKVSFALRPGTLESAYQARLDDELR